MTMSWDALPVELEERILFNLSLVELARLSSTRNVFLKVFRKQLAEQQKALCDRADRSFGLERIARAAGHLNRFIKEGTVIQDGLFGLRVGILGNPNTYALHIRLYDSMEHRWPIRVSCAEKELITLDASIGHSFDGWVSVVLVFLSRVPWPFLHGETVRLCFPWQAPLTLVKVKGQIAPLLPLVARCTVEGLRPGAPIIIKEDRQVASFWQTFAKMLGCDATKGFTLIVDCSRCCGDGIHSSLHCRCGPG
jgi:hypothetical protein